MSLYEDRILPWGIDKACGSRNFSKRRAQLFSAHPIGGVVVEIGFGSGTNIPFIPSTVTKYLAVDPATRARKYAEKRLANHPLNLEYVGLDGAQLDLEDASVDHVVSTMSLCTIPDVKQALSEAQRVLKPGGSLVFLEHGLSPDPKIARRQEKFNPIQNKLFGGCNLNRDMFALIADSGLHLSGTSSFQMPGPKILGYMYSGAATKG